MTEKQSTPAASNSKPEEHLRYTPGKDYPFVHCKFERAFEEGGHKVVSETSLYQPWNPLHGLLHLEVVKMRCMEHHKVPNCYEDPAESKKECDGFIFRRHDDLKHRWLNQYPSAVYSQTSTANDQLLELDWVGTGLSAAEFIKLEDNAHSVTKLQDGCHFLANIRRGQVTIAKADLDRWPLAEKHKAISALLAFEVRVKDLMEKAMGKKLKIMQIAYEPTADKAEPVILDHFDVVFEDEPEFSWVRWEDGRGQRRLITPIETGV